MCKNHRLGQYSGRAGASGSTACWVDDNHGYLVASSRLSTVAENRVGSAGFRRAVASCRSSVNGLAGSSGAVALHVTVKSVPALDPVAATSAGGAGGLGSRVTTRTTAEGVERVARPAVRALAMTRYR
jgi:hypothetical protein